MRMIRKFSSSHKCPEQFLSDNNSPGTGGVNLCSRLSARALIPRGQNKSRASGNSSRDLLPWLTGAARCCYYHVNTGITFLVTTFTFLYLWPSLLWPVSISVISSEDLSPGVHTSLSSLTSSHWNILMVSKVWLIFPGSSLNDHKSL